MLIVNWHDGNNAPDRIFCAHTNGDVPSATFPPADPALTTAVLIAIDRERHQAGLADWQTLPEATHFSGVPHGVEPAALLECPIPLIDVEIGSSPTSWSDARAHEAMAKGVVGLFAAARSRPDAAPLLYVGGMHFDPGLREAVIGAIAVEGADAPAGGHSAGNPAHFSFAHVLPNQWVVSGSYDGDSGLARLRSAAASIRGGVRAVVFHKKLRGPVKSAARALATELDLPSMSHRQLRAT